MKFAFCLCIMLFVNQLFSQLDFYIETDETFYSYGQDIHMTFNFHNPTADTVFVTWIWVPSYDYYIDDEFFLVGKYAMIMHIAIPPYSIHSWPILHTENVTVGEHEIVGVHNSSWFSEPVFITVESVSVEEQETALSDFHLLNHPNPFNPSTEISFSVPQTSSFVTIEIYNSRGQKVKTMDCSNSLATTSKELTHSIVWDGTNEIGKQVPSGVYLYKLISNGKELAVNKMLLLK